MLKNVFLNGKFVKEDKAVVPVTTHALHYGTACFEGIRAYYNAEKKSLLIFRMEDHYKRFSNSVKVIDIKLKYSISKLCKITEELIKKNPEVTDLYIRPLAFKADPAIGNFDLKKVGDGLIIYAVPLGRHYTDNKGLKVMISSWVRTSNKSIPPKAKIAGAYVNTCLAKTESSENGFDEALFLDYKGDVVEGSAENLFIVKNNVVITPPTTDDILEGVTRNTIIELCRNELGIKVLEKSITKKELFGADEVFLSGTGAEINSVIEVDKRRIGNGKKGEVSQRVQEIYTKIVHGENPAYSKYITEVSVK